MAMCVVGSPSFVGSVIKVHMLFVTMLNDCGELTKESGIKVSHTLRIRAPYGWMGDQFNGSLL